jgi:hypothetical protein
VERAATATGRIAGAKKSSRSRPESYCSVPLR